MAEIIEDGALRPRRRYPWDEWADGRARRIRRGEDFDTSAASMRVRLYQEARRRGLKVTAGLSGVVGAEDVVSFRFYRPEEV